MAITETVNLYDAKTNLSKLVERAASGEEIIIAKAGKPKAMLVPYQPLRKKVLGTQDPAMRVYDVTMLGLGVA